jgi:hypothetical protein
MPVLDVGERLTTPLGRIDLAADVIGAMVHPGDKTGRLRRRSALAMTCLWNERPGRRARYAIAG